MSRYQPALFGGLFIGVLSSIPGVGAANLCCCLWVVSGGVLTTYLLQQKTPEPIITSDAMLGGVIAGLVGALIDVAVSAALLSVTGPLLQDTVRRSLEENPQITPEMQAFIAKFMSGGGMALMGAIIKLPLYAVFSMLGALLGVAFFRKKVAPQPPAAPPPPSAIV